MIPPLPPLQVERTIALKRGDTLAGALAGAGFSRAQIAALVASHPAAKQPIGAATQLNLSYTESTPRNIATASLAYRPTPTLALQLNLDESSATAQATNKPLRQTQGIAVGVIADSLYEDATQAGLPANLVNNFMNIFAWDIDYTRDIHPGDQFKVMFEETVNDLGQRVKTGKILAAQFKVGKETRSAFLFNGEYLNEKGESKRKLLLRTPLEFSRISSNFGLRRHPVLGYSKMHRGTDFAAPTGTPVKASGNGVITFLGAKGPSGNLIRIKHNATYSTAYAHLNGFKRGLRAGSKVTQGQIIGYVGTTGRSTGPHLHYEVLVNGQQVDAMNTKLPTGNPLSRSQLAQFKNFVNQAQTAWNKAASQNQLASR